MLFANVCAGFIRSCYGEFWEWHFFGFLASLLCLVCWGIASFARLPFAHRTWIPLVCLLLDTSLWRCSVEALPLGSREGMSGSS